MSSVVDCLCGQVWVEARAQLNKPQTTVLQVRLVVQFCKLIIATLPNFSVTQGTFFQGTALMVKRSNGQFSFFFHENSNWPSGHVCLKTRTGPKWLAKPTTGSLRVNCTKKYSFDQCTQLDHSLKPIGEPGDNWRGDPHTKLDKERERERERAEKSHGSPLVVLVPLKGKYFTFSTLLFQTSLSLTTILCSPLNDYRVVTVVKSPPVTSTFHLTDTFDGETGQGEGEQVSSLPSSWTICHLCRNLHHPRPLPLMSSMSLPCHMEVSTKVNTSMWRTECGTLVLESIGSVK